MFSCDIWQKKLLMRRDDFQVHQFSYICIQDKNDRFDVGSHHNIHFKMKETSVFHHFKRVHVAHYFHDNLKLYILSKPKLQN